MVLKFLHLPSDASLAELEAAGQDFCGTPWSAINLSRGLEIHVDRYCFRCKYRQHICHAYSTLPPLFPCSPLSLPPPPLALLFFLTAAGSDCKWLLCAHSPPPLSTPHSPPPPLTLSPPPPTPPTLLLRFGCVWLVMKSVCCSPCRSVEQETQTEFVFCRVPYVIQLLTEGLGLPEAQVTVGSGREGWTLGAALAEGSKALQRSSRSSLTPGQHYQ